MLVQTTKITGPWSLIKLVRDLVMEIQVNDVEVTVPKSTCLTILSPTPRLTRPDSPPVTWVVSSIKVHLELCPITPTSMAV